MSVKVHEAFSLDSFQDRLLWWDDFLGDQLKDEWNSAGDAGGSALVVDAQTGGIVRITTNNVTDEDWRIDWQNYRSLHVTKKVTMEVRLKMTQTANLGANVALYFDLSNRILFYESGNNWFISCRDGGASTNVDTTQALDTNYHIFRIECFPTDEVHFYIDGAETVGSPITTNIPDDAGDFLQPYLFLSTSEDVAKTMDIDYCVVRQEI